MTGPQHVPVGGLQALFAYSNGAINPSMMTREYQSGAVPASPASRPEPFVQSPACLGLRGIRMGHSWRKEKTRARFVLRYTSCVAAAVAVRRVVSSF